LTTIVIAVAVVLVGGTSPASAHASLDSSDPSPSAILETSPDVIRLDFSEAVSPPADAISLFDASGTPVRGGVVEAGEAPSTVLLTGFPALADGIHVVAWRVVSTDGHLVQGAFTFTVGSADTSAVDIGELVGGVLAGRSGASGVATVLIVLRWISFLAVVMALGGSAFLASRFVDRRTVSAAVLGSLIVLTLATLAHFAVQGVYLDSTGWSGLFDADAWSRVLDTRFGVGAIVRLGLIAMLAALVLTVMSDDRERADRRLATSWWQSSTALIGAATVVTFSIGGHPSAVPLAGLAVLVDSVHLGAISLWIGGLITVLLAGGRRTEATEQLSRTATLVAPIAVVTGAWQTWRIGGGWGDLSDTSWGRGMIVKIAVVVVLLALASIARLAVRHSAGDEPPRLRRLVATEVVVALAVFAASAYVVGESPVVARTPQVYSATLVQGSLIVDLTVTPGIVGNNEIHVVVSPPGGALQRVESLEMRVTPPGDASVPITVSVLDTGPNHFVGRVAFVDPGEWKLEIVVRPDRSTSVRFDEVITLDDL
jgi:copper transport protein